MASMAFRSTLSTKSLRWQLKCMKFKFAKRTLFHPAVLGINSYLRDRETLEERLGNNKEKFLSKVTATVSERKQVFTDDMRSLILLTKEKDQLDLIFKTLDLYKEQQQTSAFPSFFKHAEMLLQMLYANQEVQTAFQWFYEEEKAMVQASCRNETCFLLMLDILYKNRRYDDIVTLASTFDEYFPRQSWMLTVMYLGALYEIGTSDALYQLQSKLNEFLITESPLPSRCLLYSTMLAYKQKQYETMLEILELPIFEYALNRFAGKGVNLKLLAYIHLDRMDEAILVLKSLLSSMTKSYPIIFPCVLEKVRVRVSSSSDIEVKSVFHEIQQALVRGGFVRTDDLETHLNTLISFKEIRTANKMMYSRKSFNAFRDNKMYQPHR